MTCQMSDGSAVFRLDLDTDIGESHHDAKWISIDSSKSGVRSFMVCTFVLDHTFVDLVASYALRHHLGRHA